MDITNKLTTKFIGRNIKQYQTIDSTNAEAKRNASLPDGTVFVADMQTNGRGRLGREWTSNDGKDIFMSLLLKPDIPVEEISKITLVAGIAAARAIGLDCKIKWPNDIVIGTKKVCGILTELSGKNAICGIGINVNTSLFDGELFDKATSMRIETGTTVSRGEVVARFLNELEPLYGRFIRDGFSAFVDSYRELCVTIGKDVNVIYPDRSFAGRAVDINDNGELIVETNGERITVFSGEVSVRGMLGYV